MLRFACTQCGAAIKAPKNRAGSSANCPSCKKVVTIPAGANVPPAQQEDDQLAGMFLDVQPPPAYRLSQRAASSGGLSVSTIVIAGLAGCAIGAVTFAIIGVLMSQYMPIFGGFFEKAGQPWSPARRNLLMIHLFVFGIVGLLLGLFSGGLFGLLIARKK